MKKTEPESIGEVLRETIQDCNMEARILELKAMDVWRRIVGPQMASLCGKPVVTAGKMRIPVPGASLRQELNMNRTSLIRLINSELGKPVITEMRFI